MPRSFLVLFLLFDLIVASLVGWQAHQRVRAIDYRYACADPSNPLGSDADCEAEELRQFGTIGGRNPYWESIRLDYRGTVD